jgi:hypothetical protein
MLIIPIQKSHNKEQIPTSVWIPPLKKTLLCTHFTLLIDRASTRLNYLRNMDLDLRNRGPQWTTHSAVLSIPVSGISMADQI